MLRCRIHTWTVVAFFDHQKHYIRTQSQNTQNLLSTIRTNFKKLVTFSIFTKKEVKKKALVTLRKLSFCIMSKSMSKLKTFMTVAFLSFFTLNPVNFINYSKWIVFLMSYFSRKISRYSGNK